MLPTRCRGQLEIVPELCFLQLLACKHLDRALSHSGVLTLSHACAAAHLDKVKMWNPHTRASQTPAHTGQRFNAHTPSCTTATTP